MSSPAQGSETERNPIDRSIPAYLQRQSGASADRTWDTDGSDKNAARPTSRRRAASTKATPRS